MRCADGKRWFSSWYDRLIDSQFKFKYICFAKNRIFHEKRKKETACQVGGFRV